MTRSIRIVIACAALLMGAAYALPLWRIALVAPQYPEGLGLRIHIGAIDGFKEGDLQSINGLNHYIGMKAITPDTIPELRLMPLVLGVLIVTGLVVAFAGKRALLYGWAAAVAVVLLAGLADFWKWGYEYGHELDPTAIIKIPGMSYQPPLIGSKHLLNFTATSWPDVGGWALIVAGLAIAVTVLRVRQQPVRRTAGALVLATAGACAAPSPRSFAINEDSCAYCRMVIADSRYGGEVINKQGRIFTFDSIDCLAHYVATADASAIRRVFVIDLQHPGTFVDADTAGFLIDVIVHGTMGKNVVAFATPAAAESQRAMLGGTVARWADVLVYAKTPTPASVE